MTALTTTCLFADTTRAAMSDSIRANYELSDDQPTEQLTSTKYEILEDVAETVGDEATVISDPLNGSMYGMAAFGTQMLFPIYNPMAEKNGAIFGQVEPDVHLQGAIRSVPSPGSDRPVCGGRHARQGARLFRCRRLCRRVGAVPLRMRGCGRPIIGRQSLTPPAHGG